MSKKDIVYHIGVDMSANIADVEAKFGKLKSSLSGLKLPATATKDLNETFTKASQELEDFIALASKSGHTEKDVQKLNAAYDKMSSTIDSLSRKMAGIEALDVKQLLPKGLRTEVEKISSDIKKLMDLSQGVDNSEQIKKATEAYTAQEKVLNQIDERVAHLTEVHSIQEKQQGAATAKVKELEKSYENAAEKQARLKEASQDFDADSYKSSKERTSQHRTSLAEKKARLEVLGADDESSGKIAEARTTFRQKKEIDDSYSDKEKEAGAPNKSTKRIEAGQAAEKAEAKLNALLEERVQLLKEIKELEEKEGEIAAEESKQKTYEEWQEAEQSVKTYSDSLDKARATQKGASGELAKTAANLASATSDQTKAKESLDKLGAELKELKDVAGNTDPQLTKIRTALAELKGVSLDDIPSDFTQLQAILDNLVNDEVARTKQSLQDMRSALDGAAGASEGLGERLKKDFNGAVQSMTEAQKQMNQLSQSMLHFFSLTNGWQLLKRAIRKAFETVKELDAAMTEIAVVSDYTVDEIWAMREQYSAAATQMGAKTIDLVNATKLYVQQGLSLNEAMEVGIETTKMARIANLDGAEATNLMTAALRGFNMEMEEANRVNDTYSQLAAKSAADTQEIAVAMSKTASIAANAGSSFENMSAFLTQIIETTREAPETAGTAMKTIIARFQELKKPMSEIGEVDGEIVDANGIETALRSAGVQLRDTNGEFRDFDEVIIELAGKWDSLDVMTQRYIATMAAGSRQQSRFIALMSDNARLTELVSYANNSAGAANAQYEKTLESLEAKLNKLKNAIDIFWTNLANNEIIKGVVDLLTKLIETVNSLTSVFTQSENGFMNFIGSLLQIGMVAGAFKLQQNAILGIFSKISAASFCAGKKAGEQYSAGFNTGLNKMDSGKGLKNFFAKFMGKQKKQQGPAIITPAQMKTVKTYDANMKALNTTVVRYGVNSKQAANMTNIANASQNKMSQALGLNTTQMQTYNSLRAAGVSVDGAAALVMGALSKEEEEAIVRQGLLNGLSQDEIKQKLGEAAATKMALMADQQENAQKSMGLTTRLSLLQAILTGNKQKAIEIMTTYGLITAEQADKLAKDGQTGAQWKLNAATYAFPGVWLIAIIVAIIAVVALLVVGIMQLCGAFKQTESAEERLKRIKKETENAQKAAGQAAEAYEELRTSINDLSEAYTTLENLTKGTNEWRRSLNEVNGQVLDLIETYPELAQYVSSENGVLKISDEGLAVARDKAQETAQSTAAVAQAYKVYELDASKRVSGENLINALEKEINVKVTYSGDNYNQQQAANAKMDELIGIFKAQGLNVKTYDSSTVGSNEYTTYTSKSLRNITGEFEDIDLEQLQEDLEAAGLDMAANFQQALHEYTEAEVQQLQYATQSIMSGLSNENAASEYAENTSAFLGQYLASDAYSDSIDAAVNKYLGKNYGGGSENNSTDELKKLMKEEGLANDITGTAADDIKTLYKHLTGKTDADIEEEDIGGKEMARYVTTILAERDYSKKANQMVDTLERMTTVEANRVNALLGNDVSDIQMSDVQDLDNVDAVLKELANTFGFASVDQLAEFLGKDVATLKADYAEKGENARAERDEAQNTLSRFLNSSEVSQIVSNLTIGQVQGLADTLTEVSNAYGVEGVRSITDIWKDMKGEVSAEQQQAFQNVFNTIDFTNLTSFFDFQKTLDSLQISLPTDQLEELYQTMKKLGATTTMTAEAFNTMLKGINSVYQELKTQTGDAIFTAEEYAALAKAIPEATKDFTLNRNGDYVYLGNHLDDLRKAIDENTATLLKQNIETLENKIELADIADKNKGISGESLTLYAKSKGMDFDATTNLYTTKNGEVYKQADILAQMREDGLEHYTFTEADTDTEKAITVANLLAGFDSGKLDKTLLQSIGYEDTTWKSLSQGGPEEINKFYNAVATLISSKESNEVELKKYEKDNAILNYMLRESTDLSLLRSQNKTQGNDEEADNIYKALVSQARSAGLPETLISRYIEAYEAKDTAGLEQLEKDIVEQLNRTTAYATFESLSENLTTAVEEQENLQDVQLKILKVQKALDPFGLKVSESNVDAMLELVRAISNGDYSAYIKALELSASDNGSQVKVSSSGELIGNIQTGVTVQDSEWLDKMYKTGQLAVTETTFTKDDVGKIARIVDANNKEIFAVVTDAMIGNVGALISAYDASFFESAMTDSADEWTNSYDWLYNLNARLNKLLYDRNKLEEEENRILESRELTTAGLLANLDKQYTNSLTTLAAYQELQKQRVSQKDDNFESEIEKFNQELVSKGLSNYMGFTADGVFEINRDAIDKIKDTSEGETIKQYVSEGEFLREELENIRDGIDETNDRLTEIRKKYLEDAISLENALIEAIYTLREEEIDRLEDINTSIDDANSALLDKIQESIDDMRNAREDRKALENIQEMEQRLALMRTDTSGANALDILSLEKELEDARLAYQDTQVDRAIDEMTKQNEQAAEQRQLQIDLMREQLEADKESGRIAADVNNIISAQLSSGDEGLIKSYLTQVGEKQSLGYTGQTDFEEGIQQQISTGLAGALQGRQAEQGRTVTFKDQYDKEITGIADANGTIIDAAGNRYSGVYREADGTWKQHTSGTMMTKQEWDAQVQALSNNLGTTDLIQVEEASTINIKAGTVILNGKMTSNEVKTADDALQYFKQEDKTEAATALEGYKNAGYNTDNLLKRSGAKDWADFSAKVSSGTISGANIAHWQELESLSKVGDGTQFIAWLKRTGHAALADAMQRWGETNGTTDYKQIALYLNRSFGMGETDSWQTFGAIVEKANIKPGAILKVPYIPATRSVVGRGGGGGFGRSALLYRAAYATGGLADFTGPAWLDGTKAHPEYVLNATQTQAFLSLVDILDNYDSKKSTESGKGDTYYDVHIEVDEISNDYDVEEMMDKMKRIIADDAMYRNVNAVDLGRR